MSENKAGKMYLANIIEINSQGMMRESLWYGGEAKNLALMIIDVMKDWYEPNKNILAVPVVEFHKMMENSEKVTFEEIAEAHFDANGMHMEIQLTDDLDAMFQFVVREAWSIFAKEGDDPKKYKTFPELVEFLQKKYNMEQIIADAILSPSQETLSKAFIMIDIKYGYTNRHFRKVERP